MFGGGRGLQCRDSTTYSHFNSLQHVGGYSINTLQSILILTAYGSLGGYNIKLLQIIAILTAYNTLGTLQRKASTTIRQPRAFLGRYSEKPYNQYCFQKSTISTYNFYNHTQFQKLVTRFSQIVRNT